MNHIEILELRIAPATLVSSAQFPSPSRSVAVLVEAGEKIVFDADHDGVADASEPIFLSVAAGKAMAFCYDGDGTGGIEVHEPKNHSSPAQFESKSTQNN